MAPVRDTSDDVPLTSVFSLMIVALITLLLSHVIALAMNRYKKRAIERQFNIIKDKGERLEKGRVVKMTIVTGHLGAGKTTLCNHLLSNADGKRVAMIVNELGAISIDHDLLADNATEAVMTLKNGCVCCSTKNTKGLSELERVLTNVSQLVENDAIDHICVETSGMVDPAPLIQLLYRLQLEGHGHFALDAVCTVVDAKHAQLHMREREVIMQLLVADLVIVNKVDLVKTEELKRVWSDIKRVNPTASVLEAIRSRVNVSHILEQDTFSLEGLSSRVNEWDLRAGDTSRGIGSGHTPGIKAVCLETHAPLDWESFDAWLGRMVQTSWADLYRLKGIVQFHGRATETIIQGVHADIQAGERKKKGSGRENYSRLVVIGRNLDEERLREGFLATRHRPV